jgi:hypothetical protein
MRRSGPALALLVVLLVLGGLVVPARPARAADPPPITGCVTLPAVLTGETYAPDWSMIGWDGGDFSEFPTKTPPRTTVADFSGFSVQNLGAGMFTIIPMGIGVFTLDPGEWLSFPAPTTQIDWYLHGPTDEIMICPGPPPSTPTSTPTSTPLPTVPPLPTSIPLPTSTAIPSVTLTLDDALSVAPQLAQEHVARWNIGSGSAGVFWGVGILTAILSMPVLLARMARRVGL